jgi:hypothetical protein
MLAMWSNGKSAGLITILGPAIIASVSVFPLYFLPNDVLAFLMAWALASVPIGVLIGHCVLSEE